MLNSRNWIRRTSLAALTLSALFVASYAIAAGVESPPPNEAPPPTTFDPFNPKTPVKVPAEESGGEMKKVGVTRPGVRDPFRPPVRSPYTP